MWVFLTCFFSCTCPVIPLLLWLLHFGVGYPGRPLPPTIPDRTQGTSPLLSCLPTSFRGFPSPFPSWGFGPRGNSVKRPFYKGLQHSLPLSLFTLPHLSSSLPQVFLFFLCVSGNQHRTLSYKHHVLSTSCSFPSGAQENIFFLFSPFESASVIGWRTYFEIQYRCLSLRLDSFVLPEIFGAFSSRGQ